MIQAMMKQRKKLTGPVIRAKYTVLVSALRNTVSETNRLR